MKFLGYRYTVQVSLSLSPAEIDLVLACSEQPNKPHMEHFEEFEAAYNRFQLWKTKSIQAGGRGIRVLESRDTLAVAVAILAYPPSEKEHDNCEIAMSQLRRILEDTKVEHRKVNGSD